MKSKEDKEEAMWEETEKLILKKNSQFKEQYIFQIFRSDVKIQKPKYPKIELVKRDLGFCSSLQIAEDFIKFNVELNIKHKLKHVYCYHVYQYLIDNYQPTIYTNVNNEYSVYSYLSNGERNDENLTPEIYEHWEGDTYFRGRTPDRVHFKRGDIVDIYHNYYAPFVELAVVWNTPLTIEEYDELNKHILEKYPTGAFLDNSDDSYLLLTLDTAKSPERHEHIGSVHIFPTHFPVPEKYQIILKKLK
jgi:hypothetical protein